LTTSFQGRRSGQRPGKRKYGRLVAAWEVAERDALDEGVQQILECVVASNPGRLAIDALKQCIGLGIVVVVGRPVDSSVELNDLGAAFCRQKITYLFLVVVRTALRR
jgi:hypothetical protein